VELFIGAFQDRDILKKTEQVLGMTEFDMTALRDLAFKEPYILTLDKDKEIFLTCPVSIKKFDLMKDKVEDIEFEKEFTLSTKTDGTLSV